jgi:hypothetical protein
LNIDVELLDRVKEEGEDMEISLKEDSSSEEEEMNWRRANVLPRQALSEFRKSTERLRIKIILVEGKKRGVMCKKSLKFTLRKD